MEFVEAVHYDASATDFKGVFEFVGGLVVAVEIDVSEVNAGGYGYGELAAGDYIESESFFGDGLGYGGVDERLGCVEDAAVGVSRAEGVGELAAHPAQGGVVEDEERGAEFGGEFDGVAAADVEPVALVHPGGEGEEVNVVEGHF